MNQKLSNYSPKILFPKNKRIRGNYFNPTIRQYIIIQLVVNFQIDANNYYSHDFARVQEQLDTLHFAIAKKNQELQELEEKKQITLYSDIDDNNYKNIIQCQTPEQSLIADLQDLNVVVAKYEKKSGGLFTQAYIIYQLQTNPLKVSVFRRYNDFAWLHQTLEKQYPQISSFILFNIVNYFITFHQMHQICQRTLQEIEIQKNNYIQFLFSILSLQKQIPPVPAKKTTRSFQPLFLSKRMAFMEKYLNKILKQPELRHSKFLEGFLTMTNDDHFTQLKRDGEKILRTAKLQQMITSSGEAKCIINQDINLFLKNTSSYLGSQDIIYKKVRRLCKQLINDYDQLSTTLFSIGESFSQAYNQSVLYKASITEKSPIMQELYVHLNNMSVSWGNNITSQIKDIQDNLGNWFKYYDNELKAMKDVKLLHIIKQLIDFNLYIYNFIYLLIYQSQFLMNCILRIYGQKIIYNFFKSIQKQKNKQKEIIQALNRDCFKRKIGFSNQVIQLNGKFMQQHQPQLIKIFSKIRIICSSICALRQIFIRKFLINEIETAQEAELRDTYGFFNYSSYIEIKRLLEDKSHEYTKHFSKFGQIQTDHVKDLQVQWADLMTNMQSLGTGKNNIEKTLLESSRPKSYILVQSENQIYDD